MCHIDRFRPLHLRCLETRRLVPYDASMASFLRGRFGAAFVGVFVVVQLGLLWISLTGHEQFSIFCSGPASSNLSWVFAGLHLLFLALLLVGLLSIKAIKLRGAYLALLAAALVMLPVQGTSFIAAC